jgi:hypothetical protein
MCQKQANSFSAKKELLNIKRAKKSLLLSEIELNFSENEILETKFKMSPY